MTTSLCHTNGEEGQGWPFPSGGPLAALAPLNEAIDQGRPPLTVVFHLADRFMKRCLGKTECHRVKMERLAPTV